MNSKEKKEFSKDKFFQMSLDRIENYKIGRKNAFSEVQIQER